MSDSYSRAQTRESVESAKKWLEYESFEYESRLDTALAHTRFFATNRLLPKKKEPPPTPSSSSYEDKKVSPALCVSMCVVGCGCGKPYFRA